MDVLLAQNLSSINLTIGAPQTLEKTEDISSLPNAFSVSNKNLTLHPKTYQFLMQNSQSQCVSRDKDIINFEN